MIAAKRLLQKAVHHRPLDGQRGNLKPMDLNLHVSVHYGIPCTASLLAFDSIQRLLAIATLDGRIKVIGGDGIEAIFISPKQLPYKNIEFLENRGFLVSISNENDIEVWDLERRSLSCCLQWKSNVTAFSVINGSYFMYIGDERGLISVVKYDADDSKLSRLPYNIPPNHLYEAAGFPPPDHQPIAGVLPQPCYHGNRVLIAYENGLMILWDVSEVQILFVGGGKDLQLMDGNVDSQSRKLASLQDDSSYYQLQDKEISSLCWACSYGSILAVGYVDGDILFWKTSTSSSIGGQQSETSSGNVVKLQLSSAERRLPVIVLHWTASIRSSNGCDGQLFIYGGDEIGSEEVVSVLTLEWSSRMETLRCTGRSSISLTSSFADMILLPSAGLTGGSQKAAIFVLTNPGKVHLYDEVSLSVLLSQKESKKSVCFVECPVMVPMVDPPMTLAKLMALPKGSGSDLSKFVSEMALVYRQGTSLAPAGGTKWPLTGGIPARLSSAGKISIERIYMAGYQDGSVRMWNASYSVLSPICVIEGKVEGVEVAGFSAPVSSLEFCALTSSLAVGNEHGLARIYKFSGSSDEKSFHLVTENKNEIHSLAQGKGLQCRAVFSLLTSPIHVLYFTNSGGRLALGFECGRVAVVDMNSLSILFLTNSVLNSPVISLIWMKYECIASLVKCLKHLESNIPVSPEDEVIFYLTKDGSLNIIHGGSGGVIGSHPWHLKKNLHPKKKLIAISMHVIEDSTPASVSANGEHMKASIQDVTISNDEPLDKSTLTDVSLNSNEHHSPLGVTSTMERLMDPLILICCEDSLRLYSAKNVIQGNRKSICKVKLANPCCWSSTFKKDDKVSGLILLFRTGVIEIRSFPDFEMVKESSLLSILRWNFKANMEKMISFDNEQIALANGCELSVISLLSLENGSRVPESIPCFHDNVLAAAADASIRFSSNQKKKQCTIPGILGGFLKGLKLDKTERKMDFTLTAESNFIHLEGIFSKPLFPELPSTVTDSQEVVELHIDDIKIDESPLPLTTSSQEVKKIKDKGTEREQLLGKADDMQPRLRTPEEIVAQYRKAGNASSVASHARTKLVERQEKLERISRRTAELQSGAEDFASLANELVKAMEKRNWWQI